MKKILFFFFIFSLSFAQYDFQQLCLECAEQNGFFCGDDPANWTQYSPNGCVPNGEGGLFYLNDGWADCTDASCGIGLEELINESTQTGLLYNLNGKVIRKPEGVYIENGKIKYKL
mgnify:CR=1 FL=1